MTNHVHRLRQLAAEIISAHVAGNIVEAQALPGLIHEVYRTLSDLQANREAGFSAVTSEKPVPAVSPKKSVFPNYLICLEDGQKLKMLKRHLASEYGLTPAAYREKWDLPETFPMVSPNYARQRSMLAKKFGLGNKSEAFDDV